MTVRISPNITANPLDHSNLSEDVLRRYQAEFSLNRLNSEQPSPFQIDQSSLRPDIKKSSHWSTAWSDLMMTMFILFLSLYVYQTANKDVLLNEKNEIIAGDTKKALSIKKEDNAGFPFMVIKPSAPLITAGTVKKIEPITLQEIDLDSTFSSEEIAQSFDEFVKDRPVDKIAPIIASQTAEQIEDVILASNSESSIGEIYEPHPIGYDEKKSVDELFVKGQQTLDNNNLNTFASLNLIPDKTVRIVLKGDLLFETGQAALSLTATNSLRKIATVIKNTDHMINVEGHSDDVPIISDRYSSNWELSFARANAVARFLIEDMQMNPGHFVVSGYSSYRPVAPNNTVLNRAVNRRVEIVITKTPQRPQIAFNDTSSTH